MTSQYGTHKLSLSLSSMLLIIINNNSHVLLLLLPCLLICSLHILSIYAFLKVTVCVCLCLCLFVSVCISICLYLFLFTCLSYVFFCLNLFLYEHFCLFVHLSVFPSIFTLWIKSVVLRKHANIYTVGSIRWGIAKITCKNVYCNYLIRQGGTILLFM